MFKTIKYLGSPAGDTFTYSVAGRFNTTFVKGEATKVPTQYAKALLESPAFEEVEAPKPKPKAKSETAQESE